MVHNALPEEDKAEGKISMFTYVKYYKTGGGILLCTLLILVYLITESNVVAGDWWLSEWARTSDSCSLVNSTLSERFCDYDLTAHQRIAIYGGIVACAIFFSFLRGYLYLLVVLRASRKLHNKMFAAILRAPVYFFDTNPVGRVINRFSKDIGFLDDLLPYESFQYTTLQLRTFAIFAVSMVANPWVVIPGLFILVSLVFFRQYFIIPSRNIKRLEALARSPLFSHISASLQGLTTIRAFGKETSFLDQFHHYQNEHSKGWFLYVASSRWFGLRIDFFAATYLTIVSFAAVPLASCEL